MLRSMTLLLFDFSPCVWVKVCKASSLKSFSAILSTTVGLEVPPGLSQDNSTMLLQLL